MNASGREQAPRDLVSGSGLRVENVSKSFDSAVALEGVSFDVRRGEILAVLGPSGSGKSTLLHVIAGLEPPDSGSLSWEGASLEAAPPHLRDFGLMFQEFALFPHLNVFDNVAFGLRMKAWEPDAVEARVREMLELVRLSGFERRDVDTLSGGERQRVALARSLAPQPRLLMLDEPLGDLDRALRERLMLELPPLLKGLGQTTIYVTHDQEEAFALADRVAILNDGRVAQFGSPQDLYRQPASAFVARFLGMSNLLEAKVITSDGAALLRTRLGDFPVPTRPAGDVLVLLRPDQARLDGRGERRIRGRVVERSFRGSLQRAIVEADGMLLTFDFLSRDAVPEEGELIEVSFEPDTALQVIPA